MSSNGDRRSSNWDTPSIKEGREGHRHDNLWRYYGNHTIYRDRRSPPLTIENIGWINGEDAVKRFHPNGAGDGLLRMLKRYKSARRAEIVLLKTADDERGRSIDTE